MLRLHLLFEQMGIKRGDKIALCGRNCANWAVAYLAIAAYEGVCVSILQDFTAEDITHLLEHSDSEFLFVGPYVWKDLQHQQMPPKMKAVLSLVEWQPLYEAKGQHVPTKEEIDQLFKAKYKHEIAAEDIYFAADPEPVSLINYTSGSTGHPKGVMLNGRSLSNNVEVGMKMLPVDPGQDCARAPAHRDIVHSHPGPAVRGDEKTLDAHRKLLAKDPDLLNLYNELTKILQHLK